MSAQRHPAAAIAAAEPSTDSPTDHHSLGPVLVLSRRSAGSNRGSTFAETLSSTSSSEEYDGLESKTRPTFVPLGIFAHFVFFLWILICFQCNPSALRNGCNYRDTDMNKLPTSRALHCLRGTFPNQTSANKHCPPSSSVFALVKPTSGPPHSASQDCIKQYFLKKNIF